MPPISLLASRTIGRMLERRRNSSAAVRAAGPAPMMTAVFCSLICRFRRDEAEDSGELREKEENNSSCRVCLLSCFLSVKWKQPNLFILIDGRYRPATCEAIGVSYCG